MKYIFLLTCLLLSMQCDAQKVTYIKNIRYLISLCDRASKDYKDEKVLPLKASSASDEWQDKRFFTTQLVLLPEGISELIVNHFNTAYESDTNQIVCLEQKVVCTNRKRVKQTRIHFYSNWHQTISWNNDVSTLTPLPANMEKDFIQFFTKNGWTFKDSVYDSSQNLTTLSFKYQNLKLFILFEVHADVRQSPFRLGEPNISWPEDHIPVLDRFIHFIIQK